MNTIYKKNYPKSLNEYHVFMNYNFSDIVKEIYGE